MLCISSDKIKNTSDFLALLSRVKELPEHDRAALVLVARYIHFVDRWNRNMFMRADFSTQWMHERLFEWVTVMVYQPEKVIGMHDFAEDEPDLDFFRAVAKNHPEETRKKLSRLIEEVTDLTNRVLEVSMSEARMEKAMRARQRVSSRPSCSCGSDDNGGFGWTDVAMGAAGAVVGAAFGGLF